MATKSSCRCAVIHRFRAVAPVLAVMLIGEQIGGRYVLLIRILFYLLTISQFYQQWWFSKACCSSLLAALSQKITSLRQSRFLRPQEGQLLQPLSELLACACSRPRSPAHRLPISMPTYTAPANGAISRLRWNNIERQQSSARHRNKLPHCFTDCISGALASLPEPTCRRHGES